MKKLLPHLMALTSLFFALPALSADVHVTHDYKKGEPSLVEATGTIHGSPDLVWEKMIRFNEYASFMPRVSESFFISPEGVDAIHHAGTRNANRLRSIAKPYKIEASRKKGGLWKGVVFMVIDTPFPVENRWYVLNVEQDESKSAEHVYKRCWSFVDGNIESAEGCWQVRPDKTPGKTSLTYHDNVNPGGKVPEWVSRMGANKTVPEIFESLEKVAGR